MVREGRALIEDGRYSEVEKLTRMAPVVPGADDGALLADLIDLRVEALVELGRAGEAESQRLAQRSFSLRASEFGEGHPQLAQSLISQGHVALGRGDNERAVSLYSGALGILQADTAADPRALASSVSSLARAQMADGSLTEARRSFDRALELHGRANESGRGVTSPSPSQYSDARESTTAL